MFEKAKLLNQTALIIKATLTACAFILCVPAVVRGQVDTAVADLPATETVADTIVYSSNALDEPVRYKASDSIVYDIGGKKAYLYGAATIDYAEMHLEAHRIVIDWEANQLWAYPKTDSAGRKVKEPVLMADKSREGEADSLIYNFKSRKGQLYNFRIKEGNAYIIVGKAKKNERDVLYGSNSKFTTCDHPEPHFYISLSKAKIVPNDKVITSYFYVVVAGVPLFPIVFPYAFFPLNTQNASSGIEFPKYGYSPGRGYFLQDGGYYFALSEKLDLTLTADVFSFGSWGLAANANYNVRYKYSGTASANFNRNYFDNGKGEFVPTNEFLVNWTHRQDPKSIPGMTFSSLVNVGTAGYNRNNSFDNDDILNSRLRSSINFGKTFTGTPFRLSVALGHDQNLQTRTVNLTLPNTNLSMDRVQPFDHVRDKRLLFLRNLGFSHNLDFQNRLSTYDSLLFDPDTVLQWDRGLGHSLPVNTNFKLFKWFNVNPQLNYRGYFGFYRDQKELNESGQLETKRVNGAYYAFDYSLSTTVNTTVYGTYKFSRSKSLVAMRHVVTPSINFNYTPDFTQSRWGYFDTVRTSNQPNSDGSYPTTIYSLYGSNPLGQPQRGKIGAIGFGANNTLEIKVRDKADTTNADATKKIKILESMSLNGNYNFFADSMKLSNITFRARTTLFKNMTIQSGLVMDPYAMDDNGKTTGKYLWDTEKRLADLSTFNINLGTSLRKALVEEWWKKRQNQKPSTQGIVTPYGDKYIKQEFPFDLRLVYDLSVRRDGLNPNKVTQTLNLSGKLEPTKKWAVQYTLNYDIRNQEISYTNFRFMRDLHCWEFSFDWTPTGTRKGFYFTMRAKASELQSLKIEKNSNFWDN
ncbi:MAG: LPS-assembly protein LptD [Bacteroidetes bacterium]|nr:LPS-assembly protein LptD [Bacteroidota bacterium]